MLFPFFRPKNWFFLTCIRMRIGNTNTNSPNRNTETKTDRRRLLNLLGPWHSTSKRVVWRYRFFDPVCFTWESNVATEWLSIWASCDYRQKSISTDPHILFYFNIQPCISPSSSTSWLFLCLLLPISFFYFGPELLVWPVFPSVCRAMRACVEYLFVRRSSMHRHQLRQSN